MAPEQIRGINKRKKSMRWLILLLILLILLVLAYLLYLYLNAAKIQPVANLNTVTNEAITPAPPTISPTVKNVVDSGSLADAQVTNGGAPAANQTEQNNALLIAASFSERFGSYSNQSNYNNFNELDIFMTDSMKKWIVQYKEDLVKQNPDINVYYAMETKAISTQTNSFDEGAGLAEILVKTQRQEFKDVIVNPRVFYQDLLLKLVKTDGEWKVNGAYWQ